ncbi:MAG: hypothetical protein F6K55_13290 [Moorea sp. SIO4A3]|nr:hypothetical protein [Moorena sp. SIO4A3]
MRLAAPRRRPTLRERPLRTCDRVAEAKGHAKSERLCRIATIGRCVYPGTTVVIHQKHKIDPVPFVSTGSTGVLEVKARSHSVAYSQSLLAAPKKHRTLSLPGLKIGAVTSPIRGYFRLFEKLVFFLDSRTST